MAIAKANNIKKGSKIIEQTNEVIKTWLSFADKVDVREN